MSPHILKEADGRADSPNKGRYNWPKMSWVAFGELFPSDRERLAGIAASDTMNLAAPRLAIKGSQVRPDRSIIQGSVPHTRRQNCGRIEFPLHETDDASVWNSELDSEFQSADAGADG
jgi:hypothetical protein